MPAVRISASWPGNTIYFGRQGDGPLESPFPVTWWTSAPPGLHRQDRPFPRPLLGLRSGPSSAPTVPGCNITPAARYRELLKVIARRTTMVNGWFICDRGRFTKDAVNSPERPRQALVDGAPVNLDEAMDALVLRISEFI